MSSKSGTNKRKIKQKNIFLEIFSGIYKKCVWMEYLNFYANFQIFHPDDF